MGRESLANPWKRSLIASTIVLQVPFKNPRTRSSLSGRRAPNSPIIALSSVCLLQKLWPITFYNVQCFVAQRWVFTGIQTHHSFDRDQMALQALSMKSFGQEARLFNYFHLVKVESEDPSANGILAAARISASSRRNLQVLTRLFVWRGKRTRKRCKD